jgi:hypothetical protein
MQQDWEENYPTVAWLRSLLPELQGIRDRTDFFDVFALVQIIHVEATAVLVAEPPRKRFSNRRCRKRRRVKLFQLENRSRTVAKLSNFRRPDADSGSSIDPFAFPPANDEALHFFDGIARLECTRTGSCEASHAQMVPGPWCRSDRFSSKNPTLHAIQSSSASTPQTADPSNKSWMRDSFNFF